MKQSRFWEANRFSVSEEIPRILRNTKVHYRIHKSPPPVPMPSHSNPAHLHPIYWWSVLISFPIYAYIFKYFSFVHASRIRN